MNRREAIASVVAAAIVAPGVTRSTTHAGIPCRGAPHATGRRVGSIVFEMRVSTRRLVEAMRTAQRSIQQFAASIPEA